MTIATPTIQIACIGRPNGRSWLDRPKNQSTSFCGTTLPTGGYAGLRVAVFETSRVVPNTSCPVPRVTMNDGILSTVTRKALMVPTPAAATKARMMAAQIGQPQTIQATPMRIDARPYTKPNDRSISPTTMTSVNPSATMAIVLIERMIEGVRDREERVRLAQNGEDHDHDEDRDQQAADRTAARARPDHRSVALGPAGRAGSGSRCARSSLYQLLVRLSRRTQIGPADQGRPVREVRVGGLSRRRWP